MRYSKSFQMSIVQFTITFTKPYKVKLVNQWPLWASMHFKFWLEKTTFDFCWLLLHVQPFCCFPPNFLGAASLSSTIRLNLFITKHTWLICLNWIFFFAVCSRFFEWDFFLKSLNLANERQVNIVSANTYQSCHVVPGSAAYYNYQLENKWVGINPEMFKVEKTQSNLVFKVLYLKFLKR